MNARNLSNFNVNMTAKRVLEEQLILFAENSRWRKYRFRRDHPKDPAF